MHRTERITQLLTQAFTPAFLDVRNESAAHAGHEAVAESGDSHYHIVIAAPQFNAMSRVDAHRAVKKALAPEFEGGLHALRITVQKS